MSSVVLDLGMATPAKITRPDPALTESAPKNDGAQEQPRPAPKRVDTPTFEESLQRVLERHRASFARLAK